MPTFTGTFDFLSPAPGQLVTRSLLVVIRPGTLWNQSTIVSGQFLVGGVVVGSFSPSVFPASWEWQGIVPAAIHAGQAFTILVRAHLSTLFITVDGTNSVDVVLENMLPVVTIDPFQSPKGLVQLPHAFTLSGTASEGFGPPYGISVVQCQIGNGPFVNADPAVPGVWSHWSLPVSVSTLGDTVITARAFDPFGGVTTVQRTITVQQYPMPAVVDPSAKRTEVLHLPTTSSITSWTRLEPQVANADMGTSSNARIFDPLWLLTRQWQIGEFQGEDTGSPVRARVRATAAPLTRCVFGELPPATAPAQPVVQPYDPMRAPLEALVERRRMRATDATDARMLSLAVEAGLHFLRLVEANTVAKKYRPAFLANYLLQRPAPPPSETAASVEDDATRRFLLTMVGRAPDARRLAAAFRHPTTPQIVFDPALKIAAGDLAAVRQVATAWLGWYDGLFAEPASLADDAWVSPRLEYAVSVATRLSAQPQDGVTLSASEFDGGRLDWSSFDVNDTRTIDTTGDRSFAPVNETTVPSPVTFPGAPAARFWEMEDAKLAYGLVPVGPTDLAHLLMIEYASSYGNDWYVVPLTTRVGSVTRVDSLVVTDSFGVKSLVRPIGDPALPAPYFSLWQQSRRRYAGGSFGAPVPNRFFLPPTLPRSVDGVALEDVLFMRDEMANLAWGIERSIEAPTEAPLSLANGAPANGVAPPAAPLTNAPRYLLSSAVPENWIPLLPVQVQPDPNGPLLSRLKRGAVLQPDGSNRVHRARSETLAALGSALLFDEEVPREGVHITRRRRMVRWVDGSTWVWTAFRNDVGSGEGSAGLLFDQLEPPDGAATPPAAPPTIVAAALAQAMFAIEGAGGGAYTATLQNSGPDLSSVVLQGWISQGTARRAAGQTLVDCGRGGGVLPNGTFTVPTAIAASNGGGGMGILAPGAASLELQLKQGTTVLASTTVPVTLVSNAPPGISALSPISGSVIIGSSTTPYSATLGNPGATRSNVALQGWISQGTARRAAGGALVVCGAGAGVLPNGTSAVSGSLTASNSTGGTGTLVPGAATFELQLIDNGTVVDTKTVPVTLAPNVPGIVALGPSGQTVTIGSSITYAATVVNPGASLSNVVLQGWMNQGAARRAAGGTLIICGAGAGVLPTGTFGVSGSIVASNTTGGSGTLVDGAATFELQLIVNGALSDTKTLAVTLTTGVVPPPPAA